MIDRDHGADDVLDETEQARLATLASLGLLDTPSEREFDAIVQLAQRVTGFKVALVSLVDRDRQWFKAKIGVDVDQTPRDVAFCAHAVAADDVLIVPDATRDSRFADNPLVTGGPRIRAYAGVPLRASRLDVPSQRLPMGTICVIDDIARDIGRDDLQLLTELAHLVEALITARSAAALAVRFAQERGRTLQTLDRRHRQLRQAERIANIGSWRLTLADKQIEWSEQSYIIHGVPVGDRERLEAAFERYPRRMRLTYAKTLERMMSTGEPFDIEADFTTAQGEYRRVKCMSEIEIAGGERVALIGVVQDITEKYQLETALRRAAHTDNLTQIGSRGRFNEVVDERIEAASRSRERCALLLLDLDHFKAANDQCGHHLGDEILRVIASRLQAPYLANCFAARLGGDEFVLLVMDRALLRDLPALLRRLLGELRYALVAGGVELEVSATIGACWLTSQISDRSDLLRKADTALYQAKRRQRGSAMIAGQSELIVPAPDAAGGRHLIAVTSAADANGQLARRSRRDHGSPGS